MNNQVTCYCDSYPFPHRIGGGKCTGSYWAKSYKEIHGENCNNCNYNTGNNCDVINGSESIIECEAYQEYFRKGVKEKLPIKIEDKLEQLENNYYDNFIG